MSNFHFWGIGSALQGAPASLVTFSPQLTLTTAARFVSLVLLSPSLAPASTSPSPKTPPLFFSALLLLPPTTKLHMSLPLCLKSVVLSLTVASASSGRRCIIRAVC